MKVCRGHPCLLLLFFASLLAHGQAGDVNRTIDNWYGDSVTGLKPVISAFNPKIWRDHTCGPECTIHPEPDLAFRGTWSETRYFPSQGPSYISLKFDGVGIYVYFILANKVNDLWGEDSRTKFKVLLDGEIDREYLHEPDMTTTDLLYDQLVYSKTGLKNESHSLYILADDPVQASWMCFDYAIYTFQEPDPPGPAAPLATSSTSSKESSTTTVPATQTSERASISESGSGWNTEKSTYYSTISSSEAQQQATDTPGTSTEPDSARTSSTPIATIVGGAVGGTTAVLAILLLVLCIWRKRRGTSTGSHASQSFLTTSTTPQVTSQVWSDNPRMQQVIVLEREARNGPSSTSSSTTPTGYFKKGFVEDPPAYADHRDTSPR